MALTYEPIASTTLGSTSSTITFSSITTAYTDLKLTFQGIASAASTCDLTFNNDSTALYSYNGIFGQGTVQGSQSTGQTAIRLTPVTSSGLSTTVPHFIEVDIYSYTSSLFRTVNFFDNHNPAGVNGFVYFGTGLYRSTTSVSTITLTCTGSTFAVGSTATLYGIKAA